MFYTIHPKLPMRNKALTRAYYEKLGFVDIGAQDYPDYLMMKKDEVEIHFFSFKNLDPKENYGQVYIRTDAIDKLYNDLIESGIKIHPNDPLQIKPWRQKEFSILDPDTNLITFGQSM